MSTTPSFAELVDLVEGRLPADRARHLEQLAAADERVAASLAWIRDFLDRAAAMPLTAPPADLSRRLRSMFATEGTEGSWTTAALLHDTRIHGVAAVRSAGDAPRQLAFETAQGRFVIEVRDVDAASVDLAGLVLLDAAAGPDGIGLTFLTGDTVRAVARCRRDGQFEVAGVPRAVDRVRLVAGDLRVQADLALHEA